MKGVVFDMLRDMVEASWGLEGWNAVLEEAGSEAQPEIKNVRCD